MATTKKRGSRRTKTAAAPVRPVKRVYIGPTLAREGLRQFQVFTGDLPEFVAAAAVQAPQINGLFVAVCDLTAARASLRRSGSRYQSLFSAVQAAFAER